MGGREGKKKAGISRWTIKEAFFCCCEGEKKVVGADIEAMNERSQALAKGEKTNRRWNKYIFGKGSTFWESRKKAAFNQWKNK